MKTKTKLFNNLFSQHGGMLVELLLTLALAAIMLPFIFNFQQKRIERVKNIATEKQIEYVKVALEKYMDGKKKTLLSTIGKNITRVKLSDLENYGLPTSIIEKNNEQFQLRILKSKDKNGRASLQGVVIRNTKDLTPIRTRKIANMGDDKMGFIDQGQAFGAFGTWRTNALNMDIKNNQGLIKTTAKKRDSNKYLWRIPSDRNSDGTMMSALNIGKHNVVGTNFLNADTGRFDEIIYAQDAIVSNLIFDNRTTINNNFTTSSAVIAGDMSSDFKNMEITDLFNLSNTAKFSKFSVDNLWVMDLNLSGLSVNGSSDINILKINQITDMESGKISATYTTINYTGSITPKLVVSGMIEDSSTSTYFWDVSSNTANLYDIKLMELNTMASDYIENNPDTNTISGLSFSSVVSNENATASDFINIIYEIESKVRAKYSQLNLE